MNADRDIRHPGSIRARPVISAQENVTPTAMSANTNPPSTRSGVWLHRNALHPQHQPSPLVVTAQLGKNPAETLGCCLEPLTGTGVETAREA